MYTRFKKNCQYSWTCYFRTNHLYSQHHLLEQELLTLPEHLSSPQVISVIRVVYSNICVVFCSSLFVLLKFKRAVFDQPLFSIYAALRRKSEDWLARNQNNVSDWSDMFTRKLLFQWASTIKIQLSVLV